MSTINSLNQASQVLDKSLNRISSGKQINSAADDAAGLAIATGFSTQNRGELQAIRNAGDGISMLQTAEGNLKSLTEYTQRIRELAVQSANGIYTDADRALINKEVEALKQQMSETLQNANFNGRPLFNSEQQVFQVGPDAGDTLIAEGNNLQSQMAEDGLAELNVSTQAGATATLEFADKILNTLSATGAEMGAMQNRFESVVDTLEQSAIDSAAARSRIEDADLAKEASQLSQAQIREQVGIAVQAIANQNQGRVLQLLQ